MLSKELFAAIVIVPALTAFAVQPSDYAKVLTYTLDQSQYSGEDVGDVHVALRVSEAIPGFDYSDCRVDGSDLYVEDESGNALAFDLETWNAQGESIVWVKMPTFGKNRKVRVYYSGPANESANATAVWSGYTGVWHMNEASGSVADATGHGYTMVPKDASAAQSVATTGPVGNGRVNCTSGVAYLAADNCHDLNLGSSFWVSGWFNVYDGDFSARSDHGQIVLMTNKNSEWGSNGFALRLVPGTSTNILFQGKNNNKHENVVAKGVPMDNAWAHVTAVYGSGDVVKVYVNGVLVTTYRGDDDVVTDWVSSASDSTHPLGLGYISEGGWNDGYSHPLHGAFDEIRYGDGELSARRAYAEYAGQAITNLFTVEVGAQGLAPAVVCIYDDTTAQLAISGTVTRAVAAGTKAYLLVDAVAGHEPAASLVDAKYVVASSDVAADGSVSFVYQATLGTRIAYQIALGEVAAGRVLPLSNRGEITVSDNIQYCWRAEVEDGDWADANNWYPWPDAPTDGLPHLGYPSYGAQFRFLGNQTHVVTVDGMFTNLGNGYMDNQNLDVTFVGEGEGSGLAFGTQLGKNNRYVFANMTVRVGGWDIMENSSLTIVSNSYFETTWEIKVNGLNSSLKVASGSTAYVATGDWWWGFEFKGENATVELDDATLNVQHFMYSLGDNDALRTSETMPAGFTFKGENPQLIIRRRAVRNFAYPQPLTFTFVVPESGYATAPISKPSAKDDANLFAPVAEGCTQFRFVVDTKSPVYNKQQHIVVPIIDWSKSGKTIEPDALILDAPKYVESGSAWQYAGEASDQLNLKLDIAKGTVILIR